ncbi:MAG: hypothetical protein KJ927_20250 [Candidatus Eisenbacteria bacterium]|nr:hypothetical protein [Candidatus Eisenbacteria bacterium]
MKSLIAGVFEFMVPKNIDKLDFAEVVKIRDEYDDLRKGAANFIKRIADEFELERVVDEKRANELIGDATTEFKKKVEDFKRCSLRRIIKDWKTQTVATSIGMLGGYIAGGPGASVGIGIGGGVFSIINHFVGAAKSTQMEKTVRYFSVINRQIEQKEYIEGLLSYRRLVLGM